MNNLSNLDVSNVFLYVGDAVRWDALPESLKERGLTFKTVAASPHTPTSFSSIVSGLHPPQHGVRQFGDKLSDDVPSLFTLRDHQSSFANTINQKFNDNPDSESILDKTLATTESDPDSLGDIEQPFVFVERGPGGHAPYGDYSGNGWEYYREKRNASVSIYREEYREGVERDVEYFSSQVERLEERGLLEDTLVIYTSDHGELLGEGGCLGHNAPIHPKLAYVPTVLIHPSLDSQIVADGLLRHVDFFPTIAGLLGADVPELPGRDLTDEVLSDWSACFYRKSVVAKAPFISGELAYESVWDADGGYVFPRRERVNRVVVLLGKLAKSAKREHMRRHLRQVVKLYLSAVQTYGEPRFELEDSKEHLEEINRLPQSITNTSKIDSSAKKRLKELGYMN